MPSSAFDFADALATHRFFHPDIGDLNALASTNLFVISIPKCGTTSIQMGLQAAGHRVVHAHVDDSTFRNISNGDLLRSRGWGMATFIRHRLAASRGWKAVWSECLENCSRFLGCPPARPGTRVTIFSGFREPISWYLSLAFYYGLRSLPGLQDEFLENFSQRPPWATYSFSNTFQLLKDCTGIDVLRHPFPAADGLLAIRKRHVTLVLYRLDRLDAVEQYITRNIDPHFRLSACRINESAEYRARIEDFILSDETIASLWQDRYVQHFFTAAEFADLTRRFRQTLCDSSERQPQSLRVFRAPLHPAQHRKAA